MPHTPTALRNQAPRKRRPSNPRRKAPHRRRISGRAIVVLFAIGFIAFTLVWAILARALAPNSNTGASRFDTLIVLGSIVDADGNPTPVMLSRVTEAVREYERGVARHMIFTGGMDHKKFVEAQVMARAAEAQGVPHSAIYLEPEADSTILNACYAGRIMKAHAWRSAEVVTSPAHVPRAAMIFGKLPIEWRLHPAPPLEPQSSLAVDGAATWEVLKTARYLLYANWAERCSP